MRAGVKPTLGSRMYTTDERFHELMKDCNELLGDMNASEPKEPSPGYMASYPSSLPSTAGSDVIRRRTPLVAARGGAEADASRPPSTNSLNLRKGSLDISPSPRPAPPVSSGLVVASSVPSSTPRPSSGGSQRSSITPSDDRGVTRPSSAASLREAVASARHESTILQHKDVWEETRETTTVLRGALSEEQLARDLARQRREIERQERQRKREQKHRSISHVDDDVESPSPARSMAAEEAEAVEIPSAPTAPTEEELQRQREEAEALATAEEQRRLEEKQRRLEAEHEAEKERIRLEAQKRREDRLAAERQAIEEEAEKETRKLRLWELVRDLAWQETVSRSDLTAEQDSVWQKLVATLRAYPVELVYLESYERRDRQMVEAELSKAVASIVDQSLNSHEKIDRSAMTREAGKVLSDLTKTGIDEARRLSLLGVELISRQRFLAEEMRGHIEMATWNSIEVSRLVDRELWRANVAEAERRMALEKDEEEEFCLRVTDGCSRSRERIRRHAEAVTEAKAQWLEYFKGASAGLVDEELAERIKIQKAANEAWTDDVLIPAGVSYNGAAAATAERRREEVERAIREAQLFQSQNAHSVTYQQQVSHNTAALRAVVPRKKSTVAAPADPKSQKAVGKKPLKAK